MSKQTEIRALVDGFVNSLDRLIREAVWETAQQSLGFGAGAPAARRGRPPKAGKRAPSGAAWKAASAAKAGPAKSSGKSAKRGKGAKRDPADIAKLTDRLLAAITAKPGQRMEHLKKELGVGKAELLIPVARLLDGKKIRRTGRSGPRSTSRRSDGRAPLPRGRGTLRAEGSTSTRQ